MLSGAGIHGRPAGGTEEGLECATRCGRSFVARRLSRDLDALVGVAGERAKRRSAPALTIATVTGDDRRAWTHQFDGEPTALALGIHRSPLAAPHYDAGREVCNGSAPREDAAASDGCRTISCIIDVSACRALVPSPSSAHRGGDAPPPGENRLPSATVPTFLRSRGRKASRRLESRAARMAGGDLGGARRGPAGRCRPGALSGSVRGCPMDRPNGDLPRSEPRPDEPDSHVQTTKNPPRLRRAGDCCDGCSDQQSLPPLAIWAAVGLPSD